VSSINAGDSFRIIAQPLAKARFLAVDGAVERRFLSLLADLSALNALQKVPPPRHPHGPLTPPPQAYTTLCGISSILLTARVLKLMDFQVRFKSL
jgi:hypothetical protein